MDILLLIRSKTDGSAREVKSALGDGLVIGRGAEEGVLLEGNDLSREHLVLTTDGNGIYVTDLSSNGTWLNGTRLKRSVKARVRPEDTIDLPGYVISFQPADQPTNAPVALGTPLSSGPLSEVGSKPLAKPNPGPLAFMEPAFRFVGSITLMEKFTFLVGLSGLLWLYTYFGS